MKRTFIKRIMALTIIGATLLTTLPIGASAEWRNGNQGWSYFDNGSILKNTWFYDKSTGVWCHLNENGIRTIGWFQDTNGKWYYLNSDGSMAVNTTINGYKVGSDGAWIVNTPITSIENKTVGWQTIEGKKYFNDANGIKVSNTWLKDADGKWYYLKADGSMLANSWLNAANKWYFMNLDGSMATNTTINSLAVGNDGVLIGNLTPADVNNNTSNNLTPSDVNNNTSNNTTNVTAKTNSDENNLLTKLQTELTEWKKDNSTEAQGNIEKLQDRIDTINKDSAYDKMNTSEQKATLIADKNAEISKLQTELTEWKKDDSIESKKRQYDIQQEIKDAKDYINFISKI